MIKHEFFKKRHKYCICVFVLNEGDRIKKQLEKMRKYTDQIDIIVADGDSNDNSLNKKLLETNNVRTLLVLKEPPEQRGLSSQMRMAFKYALDQGYEGIITIDGNNKDDPSAIPKFIKELDEGYDHIQGSRFIKGGQHKNTPFWRKIGIHLIHAPMISLAARFRYTDTTNGFRAYSKKLLEDVRVQPLRSIFTKYELHYYLAIRAARFGFKIKEVPVTREYPDDGHITTKLHGIKGKLLILKTLAYTFIGKYNPNKYS